MIASSRVPARVHDRENEVLSDVVRRIAEEE
jgi:hypothetical protein